MPMEKTFDATSAERRIYRAWEEAGAFRAGANARPGAEPFCIMIPPPNVTGSLHMGHAFNNTLQDILIRWKRMQGHDVLWQPGQDHAGIATQMVVERELAKEGLDRRTLGREKFLEKVWEWKEKSGGTIIEQLKRLGASCDWSRNRFTMDAGFQKAVIAVFVDMYEKGLIYRGKRLVNWDPHFETAISDLEVEQVEVDGNLWRFRYRLADGLTYRHPVAFDEDGNPTGWEERDYIVVATTRPETMLGDTGVAVHPDDPRYRELIGKSVILPIVGRRIPIVADEHADPEKGTGAVKITPAHDFNDWEVGQRTGLRAINVMDTRAHMKLADNPEFAEGCPPEAVARAIQLLDGLDRYEAREVVVKLAEEEGWLDGIDPDRHMVPHGDRSKVAIEPFLTDQWFVDTAKIVGPAIEAVRQGMARGEGDVDARGKPVGTKILPERDAKVYFHWLENIEPWCISRQLWWGHQIPVWYDEEGNAYCARTEEEAVAKAGGKPLTRDPDVLDTWFSSGLWPIGTLGWPEDTPELRRYFPTDVLVTGFDIIFFWVARMMMMQYAVVGERPFHTVYVHALVRDEKGRKMSKSIGNVIDPLELIDEFGADAVRFTLTSMAAMGRDLKLSKDRVKGYRNFGTKIWNAVRFAEMNGVYETYDTRRPDALPEATQPVNRWVIGETARVRAAVDEALGQYRFNDAANALYAFTWGRVCDWYLELSKPLLGGDDTALRDETRRVMGWVLDQALVMLHPIMPFVTEELWGVTGPRERMLVHADWPEWAPADLADPAADQEMEWVIGLVETIRSVRAEMHVPVGAHVPILALEMDENAEHAWRRNEALIRRLARLGDLSRADAAPKGSVTIPVEGATFALPLADVIDVAAERKRLERTLEKLEKEMAGLRGRLSNPKFVASAPADVVEETRATLAQKEDEAARIRAASGRLAELA
ncbi:MAG: valine--tRNA ligase [Alphaproteobacteria bacterium]|nr:MAG: valine--tRNA ligase [Alphaproteobacteria bacterium]